MSTGERILDPFRSFADSCLDRLRNALERGRNSRFHAEHPCAHLLDNMLEAISESAIRSDNQVASITTRTPPPWDEGFADLRYYWLGLGIVTDLYDLAVWIQRLIGAPVPEPAFGDQNHISDEDALRIEMHHIEVIIDWVEAQFPV